ncbi:SRPBCC family protein [Phenylobacterium sp.]|jgi:carbon monoxide dehydrogenase subunit G|uniref:SRPBCC family protein n=1 Tax=Phenylobacterium sp. TaxID=1871053 RepID=UPI002F3EDDDA
MASIVKEIIVEAPVDVVWDAVADFGAVHRRFAPGFVVDTQLEEGARIVTFENGQVAREVFLGVDPERRRLAYSIDSERFAHHNASFQVLEAGAGQSRLVWSVDVLPDAMADFLAERMDVGLSKAKDTLGRVPA